MEKLIYNILSSGKKELLVIAIVILSLIGSVMMFPTKLVKAKMLPGKSANTFSIYVDLPVDSSAEETQKVTQCVLKHLKKEKEVTDVETFIAQGAPLDYAGLVKGSAFKRMKYQAEMVVNLTDKHERDEPSFLMVHRIIPEIKSDCEKLVKGSVIKFIEMLSGPPTLATIVIELYGKDDHLLRYTAKRVANILKKTKDVVDVDIMMDKIYNKFELVPDKEKIIRSGLSVEQVNKILYLALKGAKVAYKNPNDQQEQVPIFLRLNEKSRIIQSSIDDLESKLGTLRLMNRFGQMIPIKEVVSIKMAKSTPTIYRKDLKNMVRITAECDLESQVYPLLEARDKMLKELQDDFNVTKVPGISTYMFDLILKDKSSGSSMLLRWDGEMKVTLDTFRDLGGAFIAALVLMFLLMVVYYRSFALSGIVLLASFLSIIGVIVGHYITDLVTMAISGNHFFLTATSLIGFISLMGISARSSLLLIDFSMAKINEGCEKKKAIAYSTATRAKPIMLTAIAIILGSALLATDPIFGGLGIALIFGSMASTAVSLFLVPIMINHAKAIDECVRCDDIEDIVYDSKDKSCES